MSPPISRGTAEETNPSSVKRRLRDAWPLKEKLERARAMHARCDKLKETINRFQTDLAEARLWTFGEIQVQLDFIGSGLASVRRGDRVYEACLSPRDAGRTRSHIQELERHLEDAQRIVTDREHLKWRDLSRAVDRMTAHALEIIPCLERGLEETLRDVSMMGRLLEAWSEARKMHAFWDKLWQYIRGNKSTPNAVFVTHVANQCHRLPSPGVLSLSDLPLLRGDLRAGELETHLEALRQHAAALSTNVDALRTLTGDAGSASGGRTVEDIVEDIEDCTREATRHALEVAEDFAQIIGDSL